MVHMFQAIPACGSLAYDSSILQGSNQQQKTKQSVKRGVACKSLHPHTLKPTIPHAQNPLATNQVNQYPRIPNPPCVQMLQSWPISLIDCPIAFHWQLIVLQGVRMPILPETVMLPILIPSPWYSALPLQQYSPPMLSRIFSFPSAGYHWPGLHF
jgi:hypothetical protein